LRQFDKCRSIDISGYAKSSEPVAVSQWTRPTSSNSSPESQGAGREGVATALLLGSNGASPPFVRAPAEDRSKYEKLIYDFEDISSDDSHISQPEAGNNVAYFVSTIALIN
jgi:hypothetical protein